MQLPMLGIGLFSFLPYSTFIRCYFYASETLQSLHGSFTVSLQYITIVIHKATKKYFM